MSSADRIHRQVNRAVRTVLLLKARDRSHLTPVRVQATNHKTGKKYWTTVLKRTGEIAPAQKPGKATDEFNSFVTRHIPALTQAIESALNRNMSEFGLRLDNRRYAEGVNLPDSQVMDRGDPTGEKLGGTSVYSIDLRDINKSIGESVKETVKFISQHGNEIVSGRKYLTLVGSKSKSGDTAEDAGEAVLADANALHQIQLPQQARLRPFSEAGKKSEDRQGQHFVDIGGRRVPVLPGDKLEDFENNLPIGAGFTYLRGVQSVGDDLSQTQSMEAGSGIRGWIEDLLEADQESRGKRLSQQEETDFVVDALEEELQRKSLPYRISVTNPNALHVSDRITLIADGVNATQSVEDARKFGGDFVVLFGGKYQGRNWHDDGDVVSLDTPYAVFDMRRPKLQKAESIAQKIDRAVDRIRHLNDPTEGQKEAGNYPKAKVNLHGLVISIENPKGSVRSGIGEGGRPWKSTLTAHYGYIRGTDGADGDHVDVFIGPHPESEAVFVVNQINPQTGLFDEHKVVIGCLNLQDAKALYLSNYSTGWKGLKSIVPMTLPQFRRWLASGDTLHPVEEMAKAVQPGARGHQVGESWTQPGGQKVKKVAPDKYVPVTEGGSKEKEEIPGGKKKKKPASPGGKKEKVRKLLKDYFTKLKTMMGKDKTDESSLLAGKDAAKGLATGIADVMAGQSAAGTAGHATSQTAEDLRSAVKPEKDKTKPADS